MICFVPVVGIEPQPSAQTTGSLPLHHSVVIIIQRLYIEVIVIIRPFQSTAGLRPLHLHARRHSVVIYC